MLGWPHYTTFRKTGREGKEHDCSAHLDCGIRLHVLHELSTEASRDGAIDLLLQLRLPVTKNESIQNKNRQRNSSGKKRGGLDWFVPFGWADADEVANIAEGGSSVHGISSAGHGLALSKSGSTT
jgi:hypothetical protein